MDKIWSFVMQKSLTDPVYHQVCKAHSHGKLSQEDAVLTLLKFVTEQRDNTLRAVLEFQLTYHKPILAIPEGVIAERPLSEEEAKQFENESSGEVND